MKGPLPIAACVFAGAAFMLSIAMLPGDDEIAAMDLRDKSFDAAVDNYEAAWRAGGHSETTLAQLARAYLGSGEVDKAITAFQTFLQRHPRHEQAEAVLLGTYYDGQRMDDYYRLLVRTGLESSDPALVARAAEAAEDHQDLSAAITLFARLDELGALKPQQRRRLAGLSARAGALQEALATIEAMPRRAVMPEDRQFAFNLALDLREGVLEKFMYDNAKRFFWGERKPRYGELAEI